MAIEVNISVKAFEVMLQRGIQMKTKLLNATLTLELACELVALFCQMFIMACHEYGDNEAGVIEVMQVDSFLVGYVGNEKKANKKA